nr:MAG TPA: hypothetical protein [Caudoviricetes sp.]
MCHWTFLSSPDIDLYIQGFVSRPLIYILTIDIL